MQKEVKNQESLKDSNAKSGDKVRQESLKDSTYNAIKADEVYVVGARMDGFGERMCAILNAFAVSKLSGLKFKFAWKNIPKAQNLEGGKVLHAYANFPTKEELFSKDFIEKYTRLKTT